ncbi:MAG: hypothetical protein ABW168_24175 [Sedimenticola sp.]
MLFPYTYVPHQMEKMQAFIDFIFYKIWCKAPGGGDFRLDLFDGDAELKEVMSAFYYGDTQGGDFFYGHVERIYSLFAALSQAQIDQFKQWYQANNDIEKVCANDPTVHIARYADIQTDHPELSKQLASFFKGLYSLQLLNLAALREKIGDIEDHYRAFVEVNSTGKCPFCGITDMLGIYHSKREAYDHYLPKGLYPFNSINFRNLAPACHHCNSSYKTTNDPTYTPKDPAGEIHRRKAFYPYATPGHPIEITIGLGTPDIDRLTPDDIQLTFGPATVNEEIETWKEVYDIDERYKAKCCSSDAKDWLEQIRIFRDTHSIAPAASLATLQQQADKNPLANSNFLKISFLEGCQQAGLLAVIT